ncbi:MAG: hypothetical protein FWB72_01935, partial [Firmicutes bacterium]|nr:hypothetical protein [Bacillota bacterium]
MSKNFENELVLPTAGLEMNDSQMQDVEGGSADSIMVRGKVNALEQAVEAGALDGWSKSTFTSLDGTTRTSILGPIISFNSAESVGGGYGATVIT